MDFNTLELSRFQFATTSIFHFFFVPFTVGFALFIALLQTIAYVRKNKDLERLTRFFGHLFFINFVVGVVTGIVQEFQFGMNWQIFSNFVGNIFGVPLALEVLMAFFLESTFLGLWWFGKDRLPPLLNLSFIWLVAIGTAISAFWIIIANAWMQHPVGYEIQNGQAVLTSFWAVMSNHKGIQWFSHIFFGGLAVASFFVMAVSGYHLRRRHEIDQFKVSLRLGLILATVGSLGFSISGHIQGQSAVRDQPMKYAAFSALWDTPEGNSMPESLIALPSTSEKRNLFSLEVPYLGSFLAFNNSYQKAQGLNQLQDMMVKQYGPGNYIPPVWPVYWAFRIMVGLGGVMLLTALWGLWLWRRGKLESARGYLTFLLITPLLPHFANFSGFITTEIGRQPWVVQGLLLTQNAVSPLPASYVIVSLIAFWIIYLMLIGLDVYLLTRTARAGMHPPDAGIATVPAPDYTLGHDPVKLKGN